MKYSKFKPIDEKTHQEYVQNTRNAFLANFSPLTRINDSVSDAISEYYYNYNSDTIYKFTLDNAGFCILKKFDEIKEKELRKVNNL